MNEANKTSDRQEFIDGYCSLYESHFGGPYLFNGAKDGLAVKRFLDYGFPVPKALEILADSFTRTGYPYDGATTIAGFVSQWPRLLAEKAKRDKPSPPKPMSRFEIRQHIDIIKLRISSHPHNSESVRHDPNAEVDHSMEFLKKKQIELENKLLSL